MEDFLFALLLGIAECLGEVLTEVLAEALIAVIGRLIHKVIERSLAVPPALAIPAYFVLGIVLGVTSVMVLPHPLVHASRFHGISLLISPLLTGLLMSALGWEIRRRGKQSVRIESFKFGFTFSLGMAIIRLIFAK